MKKTKETKQNAGITLIALVITIIVLLILAGVSIATLTGNNGILTQSKEAKEESRGSSVEEARRIWETNKKMDEQTGTSTVQTLEELVNGLVAQNLLTEDEKDQILGNAEKGIEAQYSVQIGTRTIKFSKPIAKVEPDNVADWEYVIDDDGYITITCYKGNDTKVVIPNSINGVEVRRINTEKGKSNSQSYSLWADSICNEKGKYSSVDIPGQGTITEVTVSEGIEEIGSEVFASSVALEKLNLPTTLRKLGRFVILYCPKLNELNIPYGITTIGEDTLCDYSGYEESLTTITIPESVTTIKAWAFTWRAGLKTLKIPASVTNIEDRAFAFCKNLTIEVDENNKNYKSIDGMLYSKDGTRLIQGVGKTNVVIAEGTKTIASRAFSGYELLTNITIPNSVTSIEDYAFYNCSALREITIPEKVSTMGEFVFGENNITVNVYFKEGEKPEGWSENWDKKDYNNRVKVNYAE